jgi:hypothetical protein
MLFTFIGLILYFKTKGGYKPVELELESDGVEDTVVDPLIKHPPTAPTSEPD